MNASQVRAKARMAVKRREEQIEEEEIESGEINLIPYLDIVTNLMLFLLASISAGVILGQLNTTLPDRAANPDETSVSDPGDPNEKPLQLVVTMSTEKFHVFTLSGLERGSDDPWIIHRGTEDTAEGPYRELNEVLYGIASRRWRGKVRKLPTHQVILVPDPGIPYRDIIRVMDALRCKLPEPGKSGEACYFPEEAMAEAEEPINDHQRLYDPERKPYDPDTDALFHQIVFSSGL